MMVATKFAHPTLPDNYNLSKKRLLGLLHRLKQRPSVLKEYDTTIKEQFNRGIVDKVDESERSNSGVTHYIPHHAVIRQDKLTTKLRVVYNASAKQDGPSKRLPLRRTEVRTEHNGHTFEVSSP